MEYATRSMSERYAAVYPILFRFIPLLFKMIIESIKIVLAI